MGNTVKLVLYVVLAGLGPMAIALLHLEPSWTWLGLVTPLVGALGAGLHVDGLAARSKLADATDRITRLSAQLGKGGTTGLGAMLIVCGAAIGMTSSGCSWLSSPQGAAAVTAGIDLAVCVLNHSNEPIQQIVTDCGAATAQDVVRILDAHQAAMTRALAKDGGR